MRRSCRSSGSERRVDGGLVDDADTDGLARTGLDTGRGFANPEAVIAHVAFANDAQARGVLRHLVRALHDAVLATHALVIEMAHNASEGIFFVGQDRTAAEAAGIDTMVTSGGDVLLNG